MTMSVRGSMRRFVLEPTRFSASLRVVPWSRKKCANCWAKLGQDLPLLISAVTWGEVFDIAWRRHGEQMPVEPRPACKGCRSQSSLWIGSGLARRHTEATTRLGLRGCPGRSTRNRAGAWLVTANPEFSKIGKELSVYPLPRHEK